MKRFDPDHEPSAWGTFEDAEALRRWSFERRTPEQRLAWLKAALELAYQSGALEPRRPDAATFTYSTRHRPVRREADDGWPPKG